jgi:hypothetical protein
VVVVQRIQRLAIDAGCWNPQSSRQLENLFQTTALFRTCRNLQAEKISPASTQTFINGITTGNPFFHRKE